MHVKGGGKIKVNSTGKNMVSLEVKYILTAYPATTFAFCKCVVINCTPNKEQTKQGNKKQENKNKTQRNSWSATLSKWRR